MHKAGVIERLLGKYSSSELAVSCYGIELEAHMGSWAEVYPECLIFFLIDVEIMQLRNQQFYKTIR